MKQIIMMTCMLLVQNITMATTRISGRVIDDNDATPLVGATVVLEDAEAHQVMGVISNEKGFFEMKVLTDGNYVLRCSYVGYETFTIALTSLKKHIDLGEIHLKPSSTLLGEVIVEGEQIIQRIDRQLVMPTEAQKKASSNGVSLLQQLQLTNLSIHPINKSITTNYGETVQLRINGIEATQAEVVAIQPTDVIRVEYHEQPGLRYGGAAAVIDYIIKKKDTGGHISADLTNALSLLGFGQYQASGKYHKGKSAFTAVMQWSRRDLKWYRENEEEFHYPEHTILNREVAASPTQVKYNYLTTAINYNYTNEEKSVFNIAIRNNTKNIPCSFTDRNTLLYQEKKIFEVKDREQSKTNIPSIDMYYQLNLKKDRFLYFDVVGTYLNSNSQRTYSITEQGQPAQNVFSKTVGNKYSVIGEAIYEQPLFKGKLTTGIKHNQAFMDNVYNGDIQSKVNMNTAETSLFTEYQSKIKTMSYSFGLGILRTFYSQGKASQEKFIFRPTLSLTYQVSKKISLRYHASISGYPPSLSFLSNVEQNMDTYQVHRGNPNLQSVRYFSNRFSASYRNKWINLELSARYSYDDSPIMEETLFEKGKFIRTYANQKGFHRLNLQSYIQIKPIKQHLSISLNPFYNRYVSLGNNYTHTHDNWGFRGSIMGMYKNWVAMADIKTSYHELWGETINKGEAIHSIAVGYNRKKWSVQGMIMNPFSSNYKQEVLKISKLAPNNQRAFSTDFNTMIMLNISVNLNFGKKGSTTHQRIQNTDTDTGILSGTK